MGAFRARHARRAVDCPPTQQDMRTIPEIGSRHARIEFVYPGPPIMRHAFTRASDLTSGPRDNRWADRPVSTGIIHHGEIRPTRRTGRSEGPGSLEEERLGLQ